MLSNNLAQSHEQAKVPSCIEIGLQANKKGNLQFALQMLHTAIEQLDPDGSQLRLVELISDVADTYFLQGKYEAAKEWYTKGLQRLMVHGEHTVSAIKVLIRLAEVNALQEDLNEFHIQFENVQRAYLLCAETDLSSLLTPLIDLSWALCIQGNKAEVQAVNNMISQIKQLEEERRLGLVAA